MVTRLSSGLKTRLSTRRSVRVAAWMTLAAAAALALLSVLRAWAQADLAHARERLLAGDASAAEAAFARSRRWPGVARTPLLDAVPGEALVLSALADGRLDAAAAVARRMRETGDPLGPLYEAVAAFEAGDEPAARRSLAASLVPPAARGLGARLERALAARDAGARTLLLDRSGQLVATASPDGAVSAVPEAAGLLPGLLERLPPVTAVAALRLAVDLDLSRVALAALGDARGSIVIVDAASGALLAAVADARTLLAEPEAPFAQRREPASIAKLLTAAAAYRAGIDADAAIAGMSCGGVERYGGKPLWCAVRLGPLGGLDHALAQSCNLAFANVGVRLGAAAMEEEYARWGFVRPRSGHGSDPDADRGHAAGDGARVSWSDSGRVHTPPRTPRQLADLSVGLELVDVTPLHAALLAAAIASDGKSASPRLVTGPCGPLGIVGSPRADARPEAAGASTAATGSYGDAASAPRSPSGTDAGRPIVDSAVARRLRQAMVEVVRSGTGIGLAPADFPIAMKTGTAAEPGQGYHVNYIGFGPLPDAPLAFCVRVTHERTSPAVTRTARDVTRRLLQALAVRKQDLK